MQRLRRKLAAKQRRVGKVFLHRFSEGENAAIFVTEPEMRKHCPELYDKNAEAIAAIREFVDELRTDVGDLREEVAEQKVILRSFGSRLRDGLKRIDSCVKVRQPASLPAQGVGALSAPVRSGRDNPGHRG